MPSIKYKKKTYAGASFPVLEMTKAEYDALPEAKKMDGTVYMITDDTGGWEAENASYDNTSSRLTATNVQSALDELMNRLTSSVTIRRIFPTAVGTSNVATIVAHGIVFGRFVYITTRIKVVNNSSDATNLPLTQLTDAVPSGGDEFGTPGTITVKKADHSSDYTYADLLTCRKWPNGTYYLKQNAVNDWSANDVLEIAFCYICQ